MKKEIKKYLRYTVEQLNKVNGIAPGKKQFQKTIYLIENFGFDLGYLYDIHYYGPYCAKLEDDILEMNFEGHLKYYYDTYNGSHRLCIPDQIENDFEDLDKDKLGIIDKIIDKFGRRTPYDLECLTTVLFVKENLAGNDQDIIECVKRIKGTKFSEEKINLDLNELKQKLP